MNLFRKAYDWIGNAFEFRNGHFQRVWYSPETKSGIRITERNALQTVALLRAVSIIAGLGASLPIDVTERLPEGRRKRLQDHAAEKLLDNVANPEMSVMDFRHFLWLSYLLWGNAYALIVRRPGSTEPIGLWPLQPDCMEVKRREISRELVYIYTPPGTGQPKPYEAREILHVRGISLDGIMGLSPIQLAAESIGFNRVIEQYGSRFVGKGSGQRIAISYPGTVVSEDQIEKLQRDWEAKYSSIESYDRPVILKAGGVATVIGVNPKDAMFIEMSGMSDERIAMLYGVAPHMMGIVSKVTSWGTGIAEQKQGFLDFTMRTHLSFHEKAYERSLLTEKETEVSIKHNTAAYLRENYKARMDGHSVAVDKGIMNRDEVRALEDMEPIANGGGKVYTVQQQFVPIEMTGEIAMRGGEPGGSDARI